MNFQYLIIFGCIFLTLPCFAQKHDHIWVWYDRNEVHNEIQGGTTLDFNFFPPKISKKERLLQMSQAGTSVCDKDGRLLFYSNGLDIANAEDEIIENGRGLNPGAYDSSHSTGYFASHSLFFLPSPLSDSLFYLIHMNFNVSPDIPFGCYSILYTLIDSKANGGKGKVIEKNIPILNENIPINNGTFNAITATRHGNGRDWWVLVPDNKLNKIYRFMLTPTGFEGIGEQEVEIHPSNDGFNKFSPTGDLYCYMDFGKTLRVFQFDRCSGELFNERYLNFPEPMSPGGGCSFSPNGRFLYFASNINLFQIDLEEPGTELKADTIAVYDGFQSNGGTTFFLLQNTPNDKIIILPNNGNLHVNLINAPNEKAPECEVLMHGLQLPAMPLFNLPNFPNYRLYDLPNSSCDTLGINSPR